MCSALVLGHATNNTVMDAMVALSNTVIGAGGRGDSLGERVQQKLSATVQPSGYGYAPVHYPATVDLAGSRDAGVPTMQLVLAAHSTETSLIVASYSEGTLVAERVRRDLQAKPVGSLPDGAPSEDQLSFVMIASPFAPNGGLYDRFPGLAIPFVIDPLTPSQPTRYDTTYHALEYDPYADFPAYFNPLALLNSVLALRYGHPDAYYDTIDPATAPKVQKSVENGAGGTDTYILYLNPHLPLLGPIRELASALRLTPLTEPLLGAIEPLLRLAIDMAYTDRTYASVDVHTPFSLITPPAKVIEALLGVPGAIGQGLTNLLSGGQTALAAQSLAANTNSITVATPKSQSPSTVPALHDGDFTASRLAEPEPEPETVAAQADTEPAEPAETAEPSEPVEPQHTNGRKPQLTSDGNKVTPLGAAEGPSTSTGTDPVDTTAPAKTTEPEPDPAPAAATEREDHQQDDTDNETAGDRTDAAA